MRQEVCCPVDRLQHLLRRAVLTVPVYSEPPVLPSEEEGCLGIRKVRDGTAGDGGPRTGLHVGPELKGVKACQTLMMLFLCMHMASCQKERKQKNSAVAWHPLQLTFQYQDIKFLRWMRQPYSTRQQRAWCRVT